MSHAHTTLGTCTGQTYQVLATDIGGKDCHTDYIPRLTLTEEIGRRVFSLLSLLVLHDSTPYGPYHTDYSQCEYGPVNCNKFL